MIYSATTWLDFSSALAMIVVLTIAFGHVSRWVHSRARAQLLLGVAFGGVAWVQMHMPLEPMAGLIIDLRNVPIVLCGAFLGWRAGLICLVIAMATRYDIGGLDRALADDHARGFVKVLTVPGKDKILGATIVGAHAGELLAEFVMAMKYNLGMNKLLGTIHIYPTMAEATKNTAGVWKKAHAPEKLLSFVERFHKWRRS